MCSAGRLPRATCRPEDCEVRYCGTAAVVLPVQDAEAGEFLAFEVFQAGAATGGNVSELVIAESQGADCGSRIAAAHHCESVGFRQGLRNGTGACRERLEFKDTHRAVPEDRTGSLDPLGEGRSGIRSNVQADALGTKGAALDGVGRHCFMRGVSSALQVVLDDRDLVFLKEA